MSTAAESEGTPPRNFKRLRKEFDAFKAADGLIFSDSSLRIEFVHDEEWAWGASLVPPATPGGAVCWVARVSVLTPGRPGGRRDADTAAVFVEMDDSYPFQAPRVSLAWRKTELDGCNAADTCATTPTAQRIPLTLGRHQWSPALTVAKLLAILIPRTLSLMDEAAAVGMDHHPERLQAFLSCGPACQLLWRRAASGSVDIVWLSVGSGLSECKEGGATLPSQYICEPALPEVGGAYYYQHLPARVQRAAVGGKRVLVLLVDEHGSRSSLPGFNAPERWVGEPLNFSHVTLPIEVAFVHDRWPSWVQSESDSEEKQAATSTMVAVLQAAAEHAEVWVSDFRTECDRLNTAISIFSGAACRHDPRCSQALTAALSARGEGGWNQSAIAAAGNLVESTAGISYLRAADDALASGKLRGDSTLMTDAELERALDEDPRAKDPLYFGGRAHAARALRVAAWEWQVGPGTASNSTAVEVEPELQPSTTEKEEEREMNEQQHTPDDLRERRCLTYNVFGGGPHADLRLQHLVATVVAAEPDVLCLQEATPAVLAALQHTARLPHMVTKLELLESVAPLPADDHAAVCAAGFLAVLSKYPLAKARLVHRGGWLDDGILRVEVSGFGIVYNVHLSGGSFGKPAAVVEQKRAARKRELGVLNEALQREVEATGPDRHSGRNDLFVCGDFNCDSNFVLSEPSSAAEELWPEVALLPDRALPEVFSDAWEEFQREKQGGAEPCTGCTESQSNLMRAALKPGQGRDARFDKVVIMHKCGPVRSVELVGTEQCGEANDGSEIVPVYPSDHFGVLAVV